jgi:hypothetical protein
MQDLNKLIDELLKRELRPNTREDLATWRKEIAAGTLSADDARYLRALHARVVEGVVPKARATPPDERGPSAHTSEGESLKSALAEAHQREQALAAERDRLQGEVAALRRELDALKAKS